MAFTQTAHSLDPAKPGANLMSIEPVNWRRFPPPVADMTLANQHAAKPRYDSMTDWHGGDFGNDIDVSDATQAIAGRNGGIDADYEPRHQEEKAEFLGVTMATDIGKDYSALPGQTGRQGTIEPWQPYPTAPEEPVVP